MITLMSIFTFTLSSSSHLQVGAADVAATSKGGTPSTPDNKRKKELVRELSFLRCITKP